MKTIIPLICLALALVSCEKKTEATAVNHPAVIENASGMCFIRAKELLLAFDRNNQKADQLEDEKSAGRAQLLASEYQESKARLATAEAAFGKSLNDLDEAEKAAAKIPETSETFRKFVDYGRDYINRARLKIKYGEPLSDASRQWSHGILWLGYDVHLASVMSGDYILPEPQ